ncbi:MAG: hypothetical protein JWN41_1137 [Thermoleophilia bacterium]|nr:hypothetical protein [Thermoleophilia bacterium]
MTALGESTYEAVFDHGGQGYGVWFDGVVRDDPMYKQFWKGTGTRPLYVRIEEDRIVLLKEVDIERAPSQIAADNAAQSGENGETQLENDADVDAAIEEAVAEAMAAAEAAASEVGGADAGEKVYSPEEAAALFAADAPLDGGAVVDEQPVAEAKPKRKRAVRKKPEVASEGDE